MNFALYSTNYFIISISVIRSIFAIVGGWKYMLIMTLETLIHTGLGYYCINKRQPKRLVILCIICIISTIFLALIQDNKIIGFQISLSVIQSMGLMCMYKIVVQSQLEQDTILNNEYHVPLPTIEFVSIGIETLSNEYKLKLDCPICLETFVQTGSMLMLCNRCNTLFHSECMTKWLDIKLVCPYCKFQFSSSNDLNLVEVVYPQESTIVPLETAPVLPNTEV